MGKLIATESVGLRVETRLDEADRRDGVGVEAGVELQLKPPKEATECPAAAHYYSSPLYPNKYEYRVCASSYTYWALSFSGAALRDTGREENVSSSFGFNAGLGLSFNWTRAEKVFKYELDGSDSKTYHPFRIGLGPVGQYSSLQGWGAGLGASTKFGDRFYINGGVVFNAEGGSSEYIALGLRNFL